MTCSRHCGALSIVEILAVASAIRRGNALQFQNGSNVALADAEVPFEHSENALAHLPHADIIRIEGGTHLGAWTGPDSEAVQPRMADFLATP